MNGVSNDLKVLNDDLNKQADNDKNNGNSHDVTISGNDIWNGNWGGDGDHDVSGGNITITVPDDTESYKSALKKFGENATKHLDNMTNASTDRSGGIKDNLDTLNEFLEELQGDLDIPGYDEEILQQMVADADEVTEKISEYGTLDESEIQKIKEANEKREQKAAAAEISDNNSENSSENPNTSDNQSSERQNTTETEPEITETRKFVICPNCGEKIWL